MTDPIEAIRRAERLVELDQEIKHDYQKKIFYERNKFNWDLQDNNPACPEENWEVADD